MGQLENESHYEKTLLAIPISPSGGTNMDHTHRIHVWYIIPTSD